METQTTKHVDAKTLLPGLNCGACGYKSCEGFSSAIESQEADIKKCIHLKASSTNGQEMQGNCLSCAGSENLGQRLGWKDSQKRDFDFILDIFENEPGPKETILPYNPTLVKELGIKKGDVMIGRPMGMSCGCPVTHCGVVTDVDPRNGVIYWCVTGPLRPRTEGFIDIGFYVSQAYEGIIKESRQKIELGHRYWFLPRRCMLQWRHSGLVNAVTKLKDGSYKVRVEGLLIG
ncbi:MAG: (Fe-S)-binding protein [Bacteroidota bacterium]|nr:(Fe-S)-binding protein [Bacteroidota bacterium]MDP4225119.1 (Fe-S)-binding protein [Bacteroidota bacterium]MDP4273167.1 (Fe-S)-binding protein [Bacteroidota bacterium]